MTKLYWSLLASILIATAVGCSKLPGSRAKKGMEFTTRVETGKQDIAELADRAVKIIRFRLGAVGVDADVDRDPSDPAVLNVKVYGNEDWSRIKAFLFESHELELRKVVSAQSPAPLTTYPTAEQAKAAAKPGQEVFPYTDRFDPSNADRFLIVEAESIVTGMDVRDAQAVATGTGYSISFSLRPDAAERFGTWTSRNINSYLAVVLDKRIRTAAFIKSRIEDSGQIDGSFSKTEAEDVALSLKGGFIPAKLTVLSEKPFGN